MIASRIFCLKRALGSVIGMQYRLTHQLMELNEDPCRYPPITDVSEEGIRRANRQLWYDSIKSMPTVEEKLHELAIQQRLDLQTNLLSTVPSTYNAADFHTYITRTHLIHNLPKHLTTLNVDEELDEIRDVLCDVVLKYYRNFWNDRNSKSFQDFNIESEAGPQLTNLLIMQCFKKLGLKSDYILNSTVQQKPRIFSFWFHGGYGTEEDEVHMKNLAFQFEDYASLAIRTKQPLLPILDLKDPECSNAEIKNYKFNPEVFKIPSSATKLASVPGFWPGDPCEFPFLLVYSSDRLNGLISKIDKYNINKLENSMGAILSFALLNSTATYQGFTPFHDLTYPLVSQAILTNGRDWRFFVYQLNTIAFHNDVDHKDRRNLCWSSGNVRLFDRIEDSKIIGLNDEVFRILLQFLHNAPQLREGVNLKPYLGEDKRSEDDRTYQRYFLRKMYSRVPDHINHRNEVPMWVKIYKLHKDAPISPFVRLE